MANLNDIYNAIECEAANRLRERGYIVLGPGDTSALGNLIRAICEEAVNETRPEGWLLQHINKILRDTRIQKWAEIKPDKDDE